MKGWFALLLAMMSASAFADKRSGDYWYTLDDAGNATITHWDCSDIETDPETGMSIPKDLTIPSELDGHPVTAIGDFAFQRGDAAELKSVVIPKGVTTIGWHAFDNQQQLREVSLPESLKTIEDSAFLYNLQLTTIDLRNCETIGNDAFMSCPALELLIPATVTSLGGGNFNYCKSVSIATDNPIYEQMPNGMILTQDKENATVVYVPRGKASEIPARVTTIGPHAFISSGSESIILPKTVTTLAPLAFDNTYSLSLTIPASVTSIGEGAFGWGVREIKLEGENLYYVQTQDGALLTKGENATLLYVPPTVDTFTIPEAVSVIGDYAFCNTSNITSLTIPEGVTRIGDWAFNSALTSISLPESLTTIGECAFIGNWNLTSIDIPDGVTTIGLQAFGDCRMLTSIKLPSSLTRIEDWTFANAGLLKVEIPEGVTFIGANALGCPNMKTVTIPESVEDFGHDAFNYCDALETIVFTGKPPVAENFPEEWRGKTWRIPITEQEAWDEAKAKYADWGVTFETYIPPSKVTFGDTVPTEAQDWLRDLLAESGIVEGTVTMDAAGKENLAFLRKYGIAPGWKQEGETVTLLLGNAEAFAALKAADAKGTLIGPEQIKEMAFTQPMIAVENGGVTVEIGLQTAEILGDWQILTPSLDASETTEDGRLRFHFSVPETSNAAFYRFVVPEGTHNANP